MSIKDDFKPYIDEFGLVQPKKGEMSGNGLLYTAHYAIILSDHGELDDIEVERLKKVYDSCQKEPGLMMRSPVGGAQWKDQEGPDDYFGVAAAAYFLESDIADSVLRYGNDMPALEYSDEFENEEKRKMSRIYWKVLSFLGCTKYVYNNDKPRYFTQSAFMGRMPNLLANLEWGAGESPSFFRKLWWCVALIVGSFAPADHSDSWIVSWLSVRTMDRRSWMCSLVASYWTRKMLRTYPNGMADVFARYFGPDHPIAKWVGKGV